MNILWLNWRDIKNPQSGGAEIVTHEVAKRLINHGHEVSLFTARFPGSLSFEIIDKIKIYRFGNQLTCRLWAFYYYLTKFKNNIDLVIDEINTIPFFTNFYVKERKIVLIHQLAREYWWSETFFPLSLIGYFFEPLYLKLYKRITTIVVSPSTKNDLLKLGFTDISILHQGLTVTPLNIKPVKPLKPQLLFIGRLTGTKGPHAAIIAFEKIIKKFPESRLTMCVRGSPKALQSLYTLVNQLQLTGGIDIRISVDEKTKIDLLKKAHVVLIPSLREGWCLVAIEAAAFGAVAVGYNVQGLRDSIKHGQTGILCGKNTPSSMAKAVIAILANKKKYSQLSKKAILWAKNFNWDKTYLSIIPIIEKPQKNILILNWRDIKNPQAGGAEKVTHYLSTYLVQKNYQVTIIASQFKGAAKEETIDNIRIIRRGNYLTVYYHAYQIYKSFFKGKVDLVIDQIHGIPFLTPFYVKEPIMAFIYEVAGPIWFYEVNFPFSVLGYLFEQIYFHFYQKVPFIAISDSTKQDLISHGISKDNIHILEPYILDSLPRKLPPKNKVPTIVYLGRLSPVKRVGDIIKAFVIVNKIYPESHLWIIGKGKKDYMKSLRDLASTFGLSKNITFFGYVSEARKWQILASSWILVMTSVKEGYGMAVLEGQAVGTPSVVYKVSGLSDAVKHNVSGVFTDKANPNSLAEKIIFLLNNQAYLRELSSKAKETVVTTNIRRKFIQILRKEHVGI